MYGEYLSELLAQFRSGRQDFHHICAEVVAIESTGEGAHLKLSDGSTLDAKRVVLALGNPASGPPSDIPIFGMEDRWHPSPWLGDVLQLRAPGERILLLGAGLTAIDAVLAMQSQPGGCHIYMLSRRGNLPQVHSPTARPADLH